MKATLTPEKPGTTLNRYDPGLMSKDLIMLVIGLTGGSGSGKSTAAGFIRENGIKVIDADVIARRITEKGSSALSELVSAFGEEILLSDGSLDRRAMADRIFADKDARNILESIVTKGVVKRIGELIEEERQAGAPVLVIDAPTLFETGADSLCDVVWLVTAPENSRLERLSERDGISTESIRARMAGQLSDEEKAARSDVVIENDSNLEDLKNKVERLLKNTINMQN